MSSKTHARDGALPGWFEASVAAMIQTVAEDQMNRNPLNLNKSDDELSRNRIQSGRFPAWLHTIEGGCPRLATNEGAAAEPLGTVRRGCALNLPRSLRVLRRDDASHLPRG